MKPQLLLAASVAALLFTTAAHSNSYNIRNSNGSGCSQSEGTGRGFEAYTTHDSTSDTTTLSATWTFELGKEKLQKIDCNRLYEISIRHEQLKLDKAYLELELLRAQIKAAKAGKTVPKPAGDDW